MNKEKELCGFLDHNPSPLWAEAYQRYAGFFRECSEVEGNHLRRLKVLASMINACAKTKRCSLKGISTSSLVGSR